MKNETRDILGFIVCAAVSTLIITVAIIGIRVLIGNEAPNTPSQYSFTEKGVTNEHR